MSKQSVGIVLRRQLSFEAQLGELAGGSFRSGSENGLSLIPVDQQSRCNLIMKICPSSFGHLCKQVHWRDAVTMPYFTALWDVSLIEAQNWLARYPAVDSANPFLRMSWHSRDRKSSWAIPPHLVVQSYCWLLQCSGVCYWLLVFRMNSCRGFLVGHLSRSLRLFHWFLFYPISTSWLASWYVDSPINCLKGLSSATQAVIL